jgi:hypothetical protein
MTCTKPARSGSPGRSAVTSSLSAKLTSPVNSLAVSAHHWALLGPVAVAPGGVGRLEPGQPDELTVVGHPRG